MKKQVRLERQAATLITISYGVIAMISISFLSGALFGFLAGYFYGRP